MKDFPGELGQNPRGEASAEQADAGQDRRTVLLPQHDTRHHRSPRQVENTHHHAYDHADHDLLMVGPEVVLYEPLRGICGRRRRMIVAEKPKRNEVSDKEDDAAPRCGILKLALKSAIHYCSPPKLVSMSERTSAQPR